MHNFYRLFNGFFSGIILFCLIFQASQTARAQDVQWFQNSSVYTFYPEIICLGTPCLEPGFVQASVEAPVTFLGESCALLVPDEALANLGFCQPFMPPFYLREENDSVFYALEEDEAFRFAYTFNAQIGDTWLYSMPVSELSLYETNEEFLFAVEVLETGSTTDEMGQVILRTLELQFTPLAPEWYLDFVNNQGQYYLTVVEGVGGLSGFIIPIPVHSNWCDGDNLYYTVCKDDSAFAYRNPLFDACTVGLEDVAADGFALYPNPANDLLVILVDNQEQAKNTSAKLYDLQGRVVRTFRLDSDLHREVVSDLNSGFYLLELVSNQKSLGSKKVLIQ